MKNVFFYLLILIFSSCATNLKKFEKRDSYFDNNSVLGLNAINADYNYYTKAVLEYLLVKEIVDGNSKIFTGTPKYSPASKEEVTQVVLFPQLQYEDLVNNSNTLSKLKSNGIRYCLYDLPKTLEDLKSGFQFNHYIFKSNNRAAMQAFGIVDSEIKESSLYIVTDYLQYEDINCTGLPTIRYAVGMRAQFRIAETASESELKGVSSLAGLAAQVETNQKNVNVTIKTIGITGIDSRLSIPSNTTFDVKTYSDYEKIIDFIRNLKNNSAVKNKELIIQPQIIPVMDDYRTTIEHTFHPMYESIELLEIKLDELENENDSVVKILKDEIVKVKIELLQNEVKELKENREYLIKANKEINNNSRYINLLSMLNDQEKAIATTIKFDLTKPTSNVISGLIPKYTDIFSGKGQYVIVYTADNTYEQAKDEEKYLKESKIETQLVFRRNSFRNISKSFNSKEDAESYMLTVKSLIRPDSYIVNLDTWCPNFVKKDDYLICDN